MFIIRCEMKVNDKWQELYFQDVKKNDSKDVVNTFTLHFHELKKAHKFVEYGEAERFSKLLKDHFTRKIKVIEL